MAEPAIALDTLVVRGAGRALVGPVSLEVPRGALTALLGPNGSGKTSLLRATAGLSRYEGSARLDGEEIARLDPGRRARSIAYVPQQSMLDAPLAVRSVVAQGRYSLVRSGVLEPMHPAVEEAMRKVDVHRLADRGFSNLSLGEQRRVLLARALVTGARTILLDEPDAYLDVGQRVRLFALLEALRDTGTTLLVVVHALDEAREHADHCVVLDRGLVARSGAPRDALDGETLRTVFDVSLVERAAPRFVLPKGGA